MSSLTDDRPQSAVELSIGGMTCASCANRIERKLNKLDGVTATVNYATEKAKVTFPDDLDPQELIAEVEKAGYTAALPEPPTIRQTLWTSPRTSSAAARPADHLGGARACRWSRWR